MVGYVMEVCNRTKKQLNVFDKAIKQEQKKREMHSMQASDERQYTSIENGRREVKTVKEDTKIRMAYQENEWLQAALEENNGNSSNTGVKRTVAVYGINTMFDEDGVHLEEERMLRTWKDVWQMVKAHITKTNKASQILHMQSDLYKNFENRKHKWLKCNTGPKKDQT